MASLEELVYELIARGITDPYVIEEIIYEYIRRFGIELY